MTKVLTYVEMDIDFCSREYGVGACTAEVGVTGAAKCFNTLSTCQVRDGNAGTVVTKAVLPAARWAHTQSTLADGDVLVCGGLDGAGVATSTVYRYNPATDTWTVKASMPAARFTHSQSTLANGSVLVCGGTTNGSTPQSTVYIYYPEVDIWTTGASMPAARLGTAQTTLANGSALVCGGYNSVVQSTVYIYYPEVDVWTIGHSMPAARVYASLSTLADGRGLLCGGLTDGSIGRSTVYIYDPIDDSWTTKTSLPAEIFFQSQSTLADGRVLVCGGAIAGGSSQATVYAFDYSLNIWTAQTSLTAARHWLSQSTLADGTVLMCGGHQNETIKDTVYLYTLENTFDNVPVTLRFGLDVGFLPDNIECQPILTGVSFQPSQISLGKDLGTRASLACTFKDRPHSDTGPGFDPYRAERSYDAFKRGSFWGKFRARQPYLRGRPIRLIRGVLGQTLAEMTTRHFLMESFDGPNPQGQFSITAKDILKFADGDRAQAPRLSNGYLGSTLAVGATSFTVQPAGIGNAEYRLWGYVAIGGKEVCSFTRVDDVFTLGRAQRGTEAVEHVADDRVQACLTYAAKSPAWIIYDLLVNYAGTPADRINFADWQNEVDAYLQRLYTTVIAEPTSVNTLVSELIEQAALAMWESDVTQTIRLQVLRKIVSTESFTADNILKGSLGLKEQPDTRATEVWTYYGQRNPLVSVSEPNNYRSALATVNLQVESDFGASAIKKIFSRWIPDFGSDVANRVNTLQLSRYSTPPRSFSFMSHRFGVPTPRLGAGYNLSAWTLQDATGAAELVPIQITRLNADESAYQIEAEEAIMVDVPGGGGGDLTNRVITIDSDSYNINLRTIHDTLFPAPEAGESPQVSVTCTINSGIIIGSTSTDVPAFDIGSWPTDVSITLVINGRIQGKGGYGGDGGTPYGLNPFAGEHGGAAFYTRKAVTVDAGSTGSILGGGGGGGGAQIKYKYGDIIWGAAGGGGGRGKGAGNAGSSSCDSSSVIQYPATAGTSESAGIGALVYCPLGAPIYYAHGGDGGGAGSDGYSGYSPNVPSVFFDGAFAAGGAAGKSIDGYSYVTFYAAITVAGPHSG